jgi:hypothetical protein
MKFNEVKEIVLKNNLQEATQDKNKSINIENNSFKNELFLLEQERQKRYREIILWFCSERNKLLVRHNQKINNLQL